MMPPVTEKNLAKQAEEYARTHRGESPLAWHLSQWLEEIGDLSRDDNAVMVRVAKMLVEREGGH